MTNSLNKKLYRSLFTLALLAGFFVAVGVAQAAELFSDGFESGDYSSWDSVDDDWRVIKNADNAFAGDYRAEGRGNSMSGEAEVVKYLSTAGYENVTLSFWYYIPVGKGFEIEEGVSVAYTLDSGSSWQQLVYFTEGDDTEGWTYFTQQIVPATDVASFGFRLVIDGNSASGDLFRLDELSVTADLIVHEEDNEEGSEEENTEEEGTGEANEGVEEEKETEEADDETGQETEENVEEDSETEKETEEEDETYEEEEQLEDEGENEEGTGGNENESGNESDSGHEDVEQGNEDEDGDGVGAGDLCPHTKADVSGSVRLNPNHWRYDGVSFVQGLTRSGRSNGALFTLADTRGCGCDQIIEIFQSYTGFSYNGHRKFGCSQGLVADFMNLVW